MTDKAKIAMLSVRLTVATQSTKELMMKLDRVEADTKLPPNQKLEEIKKIKLELSKVGTELGNIRNEITLLKAYRLN